MENLDLQCAAFGKRLAGQIGDKEKELFTDALSVLEEQGIYAFFLFLESGKNEVRKMISHACRDFLRQTPAAKPLLGDLPNDVFSALQTLAGNLDDLLLARDLLRQSLVYARYHARATPN